MDVDCHEEGKLHMLLEIASPFNLDDGRQEAIEVSLERTKAWLWTEEGQPDRAFLLHQHWMSF